jgi:DNA repair protein RadC
MEVTNNNGHRKRLRQRFLQSGFEGFLDYEIIELILTFNTPRKDCKPIAKELLAKFKSLSGIINASNDELVQISGVGENNSIFIRVIKEFNKILSKEKLERAIHLDSPQTIFDYLRERIGTEKKEHFVILFFDTRNQIICDDTSIGILNASIVHPREVFKKAILNSASHIVISHNHPSGDLTPSDEDINTTKRLVEAGKILGITIVDHLIITKDSFVSLKEKNLI